MQTFPARKKTKKKSRLFLLFLLHILCLFRDGNILGMERRGPCYKTSSRSLKCNIVNVLVLQWAVAVKLIQYIKKTMVILTLWPFKWAFPPINPFISITPMVVGAAERTAIAGGTKCYTLWMTRFMLCTDQWLELLPQFAFRSVSRSS